MLSVDPIPWYVGQLPTNIVTTSFPLEEQIRWFVNQLKMRVADQSDHNGSVSSFQLVNNLPFLTRKVFFF